MMRVLVVPYHCGISNVADHPIRVSPAVLFIVVFEKSFTFSSTNKEDPLCPTMNFVVQSL